MFVRKPDSKFNLANFMRTHLLSALATIKIGNDILIREENVKINYIMAHGGLFKTPEVGQKLLAAALNTPVTVMNTASEGGPWGMAVLAAYMVSRAQKESLEDYLADKVFKEQQGVTVEPDVSDVKGFDEFLNNYKQCMMAEQAAVDCWK